MHAFATNVQFRVEVQADFASELLVTMFALKLVNVSYFSVVSTWNVSKGVQKLFIRLVHSRE